jgi:hypothetical protein
MNNALSRRIGVWGAAMALCALAAPAQAQFGGLLSNVARSSQKTADGCPKGKKRSTGSQIVGSIAGSVAGSAAARAGVSGWVPIAGLTDQLTAAIACKLDPEEQKQAAQATLDATRGEGDAAEVAVGSSASWTSGTRSDVSGTSTVIARNDADEGGLQCIMVSDVIIVSGEETRADKRMCRKPPAARYALVA